MGGVSAVVTLQRLSYFGTKIFSFLPRYHVFPKITGLYLGKKL